MVNINKYERLYLISPTNLKDKINYTVQYKINRESNGRLMPVKSSSLLSMAEMNTMTKSSLGRKAFI